MSALIDSPVRHVNRHRAHAPQMTDTEPLWASEEAWDDRDWDEEAEEADLEPDAALGPVTAAVPVLAPVPAPVPVTAVAPSVGPGPAAQPGDGLAVPPRRTVGPFPPIRAGRGRHRLPKAVRRRPGPVAAGLMVAATTLAAGSLRFSAASPLRTSANAGHQCAPLLPGEPCG